MITSSQLLGSLFAAGFKLQGSQRRKEMFKTNADWDFYCSEEQWNTFSFRAHFGDIPNKAYHDCNTLFVLRHRSHCFQIDVQVVKDLELKHKMEDFCDNNPWMFAMPKYTRKELWNLVYSKL